MQPHPVLSPHYSSENEKQKFLRGLFDESAHCYEGIASWGFFGSGHWYRRQALGRAGLKRGMTSLDIATGTGPTARAMADILGGPSGITCIEPSIGMLKESRKLLPAAHVQAGADNLPLRSGIFDFLAMGFALRHVNSLDTSFREYHRVLKPGGRVLIMDITPPRHPAGYFLTRLYFRDVLPFLTRIFTGSQPATYLMKYYWETMDQMVAPATVLEALRGAGFEEIHHHQVAGMFSEYQCVKK